MNCESGARQNPGASVSGALRVPFQLFLPSSCDPIGVLAGDRLELVHFGLV